MRLIDANRLMELRRMSKYYHLPNGDTAIPLIDIEHAPTVDAQPIAHGYWFEDSDPGEPINSHWSCSCCKHCFGINAASAEALSMVFEYCPHCGAKMDAEPKRYNKE